MRPASSPRFRMEGSAFRGPAAHPLPTAPPALGMQVASPTGRAALRAGRGQSVDCLVRLRSPKAKARHMGGPKSGSAGGGGGDRRRYRVADQRRLSGGASAGEARSFQSLVTVGLGPT